MDFKNLKKNSKSAAEALTQELEKLNTSHSYTDDRIWYPSRDKAGNGYAVIRFLPAVNGEDIPWVRIFSHSFKGKGGWFIENCPTTISLKCPLCESNTELWNSGIEKDKTIARDRKRKLSYVSNIYVVDDPANPENNGKVFLFKYGKKIFDKVNEAMHPEFQDEEPMNPFDFWAGANFKIKIRQVEGYANYDKSEFDKTAPLDKDDDKLEAIWKLQYPLLPFIAPDQFKSYEELSARLRHVLFGNTGTVTADQLATSAASSVGVKDDPEPESDDALSYFERLAAE